MKSRKRERRRNIDKERGRLDKIARGKLESGLTPERAVLLTWVRMQVISARTWYNHRYDGGESQCLICGTKSSAPPRLRWMWILKHEQDHVIALGRENVEAFHALRALRSSTALRYGFLGTTLATIGHEEREDFETVFGLERASKRW